MRPSRFCPAILCALALVAVGTVPTGAQQAEQAVPDYQYWYVITHTVDPADVPQYQAVMTKIVEASQQHDNPNFWAAYTAMTGGPAAEFYYLLAMETMGDFDGWTAPMQVVADVMGAEQAAELMHTLGDVTKPKVAIWAEMDGMSFTDPAAAATPAEHAFWMRVHVQAGRAQEFAQIMQKIVAAYQAHPKPVHWGTSRCIIGTEGLEYSIFIGFDRWAEMDDWPEMPEVLTAAQGAEETAALFASWNELAKGETNFLEFVPELSHLPTME
jgi:hypothetical protein